MKTVIAVSFNQAREWARKQAIGPREWRYVDLPEQLQGLEFAPGDVVCLPGWDQRRTGPQSERMREMIATRTRL